MGVKSIPTVITEDNPIQKYIIRRNVLTRSKSSKSINFTGHLIIERQVNLSGLQCQRYS